MWSWLARLHRHPVVIGVEEDSAFNIEQRRTVETIQSTHVNFAVAHLNNRNDNRRDWVWPIWGSEGKNANFLAIRPRGTPQPIAPRLVQYSGGRISVDLQQQNKLCSEHKCIEQVKLGQIDIGSSSAGNMGAFGSTFDTNFLPYLFKTDSYAMKVLDMKTGWYGKELRQRVRKEMDLHLLASVVSGGFRSLDNTVREVRVPKDLKGIAVYGNPAA